MSGVDSRLMQRAAITVRRLLADGGLSPEAEEALEAALGVLEGEPQKVVDAQPTNPLNAGEGTKVKSWARRTDGAPMPSGTPKARGEPVYPTTLSRGSRERR